MTNYSGYNNTPPQQYPGPVGQQSNALAITSLITGIIGFSVVALITGYIAKKQFRENPGKYSGAGMATAGIVLGYIWLALVLIPICVIVVLALAGPGIGEIFSNITESIYLLGIFAV